MNVIDWAERGSLPDPLIRLGIRGLLRKRLRDERGAGQADAARERIEALRASPIAIETDAANRQHYEVPPAFFETVLGPRLKYSACLWTDGVNTLAEAEEAMLEQYAQRALLENGQQVLDLGCGWGSLSLWMAERYPDSHVTAVSNSAPQRAFIEARARERGLGNLRVITEDVNRLSLDVQFDRVVSIEMFEHMRNYADLMRRISGWLRPAGVLFVHIFCHRQYLYPFEAEGEDNWMGRHFFTGGLMPAWDTLDHFQEDMHLDRKWRVNGRHYQLTSEAWLQRLDARRDQVQALFARDLGDAGASRQVQRWRMFFMACAELFGYRGGDEWLVGHYRFRRP